MLDVQDLVTSYGVIEALKGIRFHVNDGEIVSLIGANGAGKTTTLLTISGVLRPSRGVVTLDGRQISGRRPHTIVRLGVVQVAEGRQIFKRLTVLENLHAGAYIVRSSERVDEDLERVFARFPRLKERAFQVAGTLSGGEQQMLVIARSLMSRPKLLLLDEPSMGLAPVIVDEVFRLIEEINRAGTTILLVEQNANKALQIAHRAYVMATGRIVMEGTGRGLLETEEIQVAYLGRRRQG